MPPAQLPPWACHCPIKKSLKPALQVGSQSNPHLNYFPGSLDNAVTNTSLTDYQHMDTCPLGSDWISFQNSSSNKSGNLHKTRKRWSMRLMSYNHELIQLASFPRYLQPPYSLLCETDSKATSNLIKNSFQIATLVKHPLILAFSYVNPIKWRDYSLLLS